MMITSPRSAGQEMVSRVVRHSAILSGSKMPALCEPGMNLKAPFFVEHGSKWILIDTILSRIVTGG
jgi:hypothetical protein